MRIIFDALSIIILLCFSRCLTAIEFDINKQKTFDVHFVDQQKSTPDLSWRDGEISFAYRNEPVSHIVSSIMAISGRTIQGLSPLEDRVPSFVMMTQVTAFKAVTILLKCEGFRFVETAAGFQALEDASIDRKACLY
jgi:hypothetical protein